MIQEVELLKKILETLNRIERHLRPVGPPAAAIELEVFKTTKDGLVRMTDMKLSLGENAQIKVKAIKDAAGNPALVDGVLTWAVAGDQGLGDLVADADGLGATFTRNGTVGVCSIQVSGDADLGAGVKTIMGEVQLECLGGEAVSFDLEATVVPAVVP